MPYPLLWTRRNASGPESLDDTVATAWHVATTARMPIN